MLHVGELGFGHGFADRPQGLGLAFALRKGHVDEDAALGAIDEGSLGARSQSLLCPAVGELGEHVPGMRLAQGIHGRGLVPDHGLEHAARDEFERREPVAHQRAQGGQQLDGFLRIFDGDPRGGTCGRFGKELEHGGGDDSQCPLGAHEEVLEVVAGVVLPQRLEPVPDAPVGQHDFQAEHEVARIAVAKHADAAGVGRQVAADLAAALRGK